MTEYAITPIPKPRMTRRDKWLDPPRERVRVYFNFCDLCRMRKVYLPSYRAHVTFVLPMPTSWSLKKKKAVDGKAHMNVPDLDNLLKALGDALYGDDSGLWDIHITKRWGYEGKIIIEEDSNAV